MYQTHARPTLERNLNAQLKFEYHFRNKQPNHPWNYSSHLKKEATAAFSDPITARGKPGQNPNNLLTCSATIATRTQREGNQDKSVIAKLRR
mmetsp:Transcript_18012/g.28010  ORF Transcript_18012/g.28010 Transcript_18012/m.28010 type:complete len:92 (-) Transcript_18012:93-368(-)